MQAGQVPGAAIGIVGDGRLVWSQGLGVASLETRQPVTPDMLFRLGSTTKMMTAAVLAGLEPEGKFKLDAPLGTFISGLAPDVAALTPHQLLTHQSGLKDEATMQGSHDDEALAAFVRSWKNDYFFTRPGAIYSYANTGYHLAGHAIEALTGQPYADAMRDRLFLPLEMKRTTLRPLMAMTYPLAQGHDGGAIVRPAADNAANWPAGSVFTSIQEWARLVIAFMDGGSPAMPSALIARMTQPYAAIPGETEEFYGYGLVISKAKRGLTWSHGGGRAGYGSMLVMVPEKKWAILVQTNRTGASLPKTVQAAVGMVLGPEPETTETLQPVDPDLAGRCEGVYVNGTQRVELRVQDGKLMTRGASGMVEVQRAGPDRLAAGPLRAVLVRNPAGEVEYLHLGGRSLRKQPPLPE